MYLIFLNQEETEPFNRAEAQRRGCTGTTTKWYSEIVHPVDGRIALDIEEDHLLWEFDSINPDEHTLLEELPEDWFIENEIN